jgi:hypothetical protein
VDISDSSDLSYDSDWDVYENLGGGNFGGGAGCDNDDNDDDGYYSGNSGGGGGGSSSSRSKWVFLVFLLYRYFNHCAFLSFRLL